jgi:hypothetical protein
MVRNPTWILLGAILAAAAANAETASSAVPVPAAAATTPSPPAGWTLGSDGAYTQTQSGVICRAAVGPYSLVRLDGPSAPNILGVCVYSGGTARVGEVRVRTFIDGVGDTPLAIQNDRMLMGTVPATGVPAGGKLLSSFRVGPGPQIDGVETAQVVITSLENGLLRDCISQTGRDKAERDFGFENFLKACMPGH